MNLYLNLSKRFVSKFPPCLSFSFNSNLHISVEFKWTCAVVVRMWCNKTSQKVPTLAGTSTVLETLFVRCTLILCMSCWWSPYGELRKLSGVDQFMLLISASERMHGEIQLKVILLNINLSVCESSCSLLKVTFAMSWWACLDQVAKASVASTCSEEVSKWASHLQERPRQIYLSPVDSCIWWPAIQYGTGSIPAYFCSEFPYWSQGRGGRLLVAVHPWRYRTGRSGH